VRRQSLFHEVMTVHSIVDEQNRESQVMIMEQEFSMTVVIVH